MNKDNIRYNIGKAHNTESGILPNGELFSLDSIKTRLNNNMAILGASGAGKTRSVVIPNILSACGSYIVADPKGNLYKKYGDYMTPPPPSEITYYPISRITFPDE